MESKILYFFLSNRKLQRNYIFIYITCILFYNFARSQRMQMSEEGAEEEAKACEQPHELGEGEKEEKIKIYIFLHLLKPLPCVV